MSKTENRRPPARDLDRDNFSVGRFWVLSQNGFGVETVMLVITKRDEQR